MLTESLPVYRDRANNGVMLCPDENKRAMAFKLICPCLLVKNLSSHSEICSLRTTYFHDGNETDTAAISNTPGYLIIILLPNLKQNDTCDRAGIPGCTESVWGVAIMKTKAV